MTAAEAVLAAMFVGLTAYVLFAGADFGAGVWDLVAGGTRRGRAQRELIEHSLAPVWEANHVWLIFVLVVLWTGFPPAFAAVASTLYIPLTLAALGMIARGSAFAFRKTVPSLALQRLFGAAFAFSSFVTPFFLGAVVGGIASGRVPPGIAAGDVLTSWLNPTSALGGVLAIGVCAYLAAVLLCADAEREVSAEAADQFRARGLITAVLVGVVALVGVVVLRADAPRLFDGLTHRGLPLMIVSGLAGLASIGLLIRRRYGWARIAGALAVVAVLWGWAAAQYPYIQPPSVTIADAAASRTTLITMLISLAIGSVLLIPALAYLYVLFQRSHHPAGTAVPGRDRR
ncbi:MAG TPA: cytochrome d ubiquinol oxidase subunit II [Actinoplanes sp.]|nr:cytochrome d ubiquinol oxidase subunit II [Actinoplanes sp.]